MIINFKNRIISRFFLILTIGECMKKSNKVTLFYVLSSIALFLCLIVGGIYGVYVSVGLNFAKSSVPNIAGNGGGISNVSIKGTVNYTPSMTGVILLSIILVALAIVDLIIMIRQIVFFKQFKIIRTSSLENKIEQKTNSKGMVIFWTFFIDIICIIVGIVGVFINNRSFAGKSNFSWVFYTVDIAVSVLALISIILLIVKLRMRKKIEEKNEPCKSETTKKPVGIEPLDSIDTKDINQMEYKLLKLEIMKKAGLISQDEYAKIRKRIVNVKNSRVKKSQSM